jgi:branched-chain amino acid transport system ATP-binding protein
LSAVLQATGISVSFGGVHALTGVDLEVGDGRLVGLIGPNGAGKTTFIDAITGFVRSRGSIEIDGRDVTALPPHTRARLGLVRTWQSVELFDDLSVLENLSVVDPATAEEALQLLRLDHLATAMPSEISQAQRKLVGLARALAAKPRLLCLDEPASGLDVNESEQLGRRLRSIVDAGTAMLLIDHDMGLVLGICDHVVVLEFGKVIAAGAPDDVRGDERVVAAYLGSAAAKAGVVEP